MRIELVSSIPNHLTQPVTQAASQINQFRGRLQIQTKASPTLVAGRNPGELDAQSNGPVHRGVDLSFRVGQSPHRANDLGGIALSPPLLRSPPIHFLRSSHKPLRLLAGDIGSRLRNAGQKVVQRGRGCQCVPRHCDG